MIVQFDTSSGTWRVIASDGTIVMDFSTRSAARKWIDAATDQAHAATVDRIREAAFSTR